MGRSGQTATRAAAALPQREAAARWRLLYRIPDGATSWQTTVEAGERGEAEFRGRLALQEAFTPHGSVQYRANNPDWWRRFELVEADPVA